MVSRIDQLINEIEEFIDSCKYQPLSNTKILVNKEELEELLVELRLRIPDEIKQYQKIISNRDAIINEAHQQADSILQQATAQTNQLVNEHEIMQRAYAQANQLIEQATAQAQSILDNATEDANNIRMGAVSYTDEMLSKLQYIIEHSIKDNKEKYNSLISDLENVLAVVNNNRNELNASSEDDDSEEISSQELEEASKEDFNVDIPISK